MAEISQDEKELLVQLLKRIEALERAIDELAEEVANLLRKEEDNGQESR